MAFVSTVRRFAFLVILLAAFVPTPAQGNDEYPCPDGYCDNCEIGQGFCWTYIGETCSGYGCEHVGLCAYEGGGYPMCWCPPCE